MPMAALAAGRLCHGAPPRTLAAALRRCSAAAAKRDTGGRGDGRQKAVDRYRKGKVFFPAYSLPELLHVENRRRRVAISDSEPSVQQLSLANIEPHALRPYLDASDPVLRDDHFNVSQMCTVDDLFRARVHWGHKLGTLDEHSAPYLFGHRLGVCLFDLAVTLRHLRRALNFLAHVAHKGGVVLFVSNDRANMHLIEAAAADCGEYSHTRTWLPGTLTSSADRFGNEIRLPDCVVVLRTQNNQFAQHDAIVEAAKMLIPTVGIVDSNCSPLLVTYPIPGNDDSAASVRLYLDLFTRAIMAGKRVKQLEGAPPDDTTIVLDEADREPAEPADGHKIAGGEAEHAPALAEPATIAQRAPASDSGIVVDEIEQELAEPVDGQEIGAADGEDAPAPATVAEPAADGDTAAAADVQAAESAADELVQSIVDDGQQAEKLEKEDDEEVGVIDMLLRKGAVRRSGAGGHAELKSLVEQLNKRFT